jgi:hypothetical protein
VADALLVESQSRLNSGQPTSRVTLAPFDGILLARVCEEAS